MKILVIGSLNKDYVYTVEHIVRPGETVLSKDNKIFWGGKGFNQCVALARAGAPAVFACKVAASDKNGLDSAFENYGLKDAYMDSGGSVTGHTIIQIDENGQNCILLCPGANHELERDWIDNVLDNFGSGDIILLQNEINNVGYIMSEAKKRGVKIAFNPSPISKDLKNYALDLVDIFFINEVECEEITGVAGDPEEMSEAMRKMYPNAAVVLTLGKNGSVYTDKNNRVFQPSYKVEAVDTTAAGDTFTGYFLTEYAKGAAIGEALNTAAKAAAISVTISGATNSIPSFDDVKNFNLCN